MRLVPRAPLAFREDRGTARTTSTETLEKCDPFRR
jgi:hypothetical protein